MDDPYYMTPAEEREVELRAALDRITLLEGQLEDAQITIGDLKAENCELLAETSKWAQLCTGRHGSQMACINAPYPTAPPTVSGE
jgi:hypothetical protein